MGSETETLRIRRPRWFTIAVLEGVWPTAAGLALGLALFIETVRKPTGVSIVDDWLVFAPVGGLVLIGVVVPLLAASWLRSRSGEARLSADRGIELTLGEVAWRSYAWEELADFDDASPEFVRLWTRRPRVETFTVPTPDEATRARVLGLLVERGLRRRES